MQEFSWATPYFPNSFVCSLPIFLEPLEDALSVLPSFIRDRMSVFVCEINGVHHLPINIKLQLLVSGIANAYRPRVLVAAEMIEKSFFRVLFFIKPVQSLSRTALGVVTQSNFEPFDEEFCFIHKPKSDQCIQCEGGIA